MEQNIDNQEFITTAFPTHFHIRAMAAIIDIIILVVYMYVILLLKGDTVGMFSARNQGFLDEIVYLFVDFTYNYFIYFFVFRFFYFSLFESSKLQGTPGKYLMKIKVVDNNGGRVSIFKAMARYLIKYVSSNIWIITVRYFTMGFWGYITFYIPYLYSIIDSEKRTLHDLLTSSNVVYKD
jgi:uncharacterized RDD family membrane protein YckC